MTMWVAGASVVSAGIGYMGSKQSASAMKKAGKDPFGRANRVKYQGELNALMSNPSSIYDDPTFTSALDLGLTGVQRKMAAQGFLGSGNEATALMEYGMGFGLDWLKNQENFLALLAGAGQGSNPSAQVAGAAQDYGGMMSALGQLGGAFGMMGGGGSTTGGGVIGGGGYGSNTLGGGNWGSFYPTPSFSTPTAP